MATVKITVAERIARVNAGIKLICNNPTDIIRFEFDEEWNGHAAKTARFSWDNKYIDVPFSGNEVQVPEIFQTNYVYVGVFSDDLTSTPVKLDCRYSIKCLGGKVLSPSEDVYAQIIALINAGITSNDGTSVENADINTSGHLLLTLSNGKEIDCGVAKGTDGTSVTILGSYDSYDALVAEHPTGTMGDSYLVAEDLYIWSENNADWINVGNIRGPAGEQGVQGNDGLTPVRGEDYWTEEDIATIKGYVDEAILGGAW